jgi:hypothetical protein
MAEINQAKEIVQKAVVEASKPEIFKLTYKFRGQIHECLFYASDLEKAKMLGDKYTTAYGYKFLHVTKAVHDLEELTKRKMENVA